MGEEKRNPRRTVKRLFHGLLDLIALLVVVALFVVVLTPGEAGEAGRAGGAAGAAPEEPAPSVGGADADGADDGAAGRAATRTEGGVEIAAGRIRRHILEHGTAETGAYNLVTAIYLGYRAFDTLGETIVLLLAVSGVAHLVRAKQ